MKRYYIFSETYEDNTYLEIYAGSDEKFEKRENMVKVQGENLWYTRDFGNTWEKVELKGNDVEAETKSEKKADASLPDEPIDVASMLINATITVDPSKFGALSSLHDKEPQTFAKYDTNQLREIAEHLLVYCDAQERGCADACCENCEP
nr:MAG TPA: BNR/Asp-box repeat protein [Caudoviricetes sp.]